MVNNTRKGEIEFHFHAPDAKEVYLVGDFNEWNESALPMKQSEMGEWTSHLELPDGVYQFKYLADGRWYLDDGLSGTDWVPFICNSVLVVRKDNQPAIPLG